MFAARAAAAALALIPPFVLLELKAQFQRGGDLDAALGAALAA